MLVGMEPNRRFTRLETYERSYVQRNTGRCRRFGGNGALNGSAGCRSENVPRIFEQSGGMKRVTVDGLRQWIRQEVGTGRVEVKHLYDAAAKEFDLPVTTAVESVDTLLGQMDDMVKMFNDAGEIRLVTQERYALNDIVFLHRVTPIEVVDNALDVSLDGIAAPYIGNQEDSESDEEVRFVEPAGLSWNDEGIVDRVVGPSGWLAGRDNTWVGLQQTPKGWKVEFFGSEEPINDESKVESLAAWFGQIGPDEKVDASVLVDTIFELLGPVGSTVNAPPIVFPALSVLAESLGYSTYDGWVGGPEIDWSIEEGSDSNDDLTQVLLAHRWGVSAKSVKAAAQLLSCARLVEALHADGRHDIGSVMSENDRAVMLEGLRSPEVVLLVKERGVFPTTHPNLQVGPSGFVHDGDYSQNFARPNGELVRAWQELLRELSKTATGRAAANIGLLQSLVADGPTARKALLESAAKHDRRNVAVLDELLWLAAVRGETTDGRSVLRSAVRQWVEAGGISKAVAEGRAEANPAQMVRFAATVLSSDPVRNSGPQVGRNEPCPCGSGRKFKQCHLGKPLESSNDSNGLKKLVPWIQALLLFWHSRVNGPRFGRIVKMLESLPEGDPQNLQVTFAVDGDVMGFTMVERFIADVESDRATPLPSALVSLLRQWVDEPLRLCEVVDRAPGIQLTLRDLVAGDVMIVEAPDTSRYHQIGNLVITRVIRNGDALQSAFGIVTIEWVDRDAVLAFLDEYEQQPPAEAISELLTGRAGRANLRKTGEPSMQNTDGDEVVFMSATVTIQDDILRAHEVSNRLNDHRDLLPGSEREWAVVLAGDASQTHRGSIEMVTDDPVEFHVTANSRPRMSAALALLRECLGDIELQTVNADSLEDAELAEHLGLADQQAGTAWSSNLATETLSPEAIAEVQEHFTQRWLADRIPALGGLTPFEAAADPTRRADLIALLRSFENSTPGDAVPFSPDPAELARRLGVKLREPGMPKL
jgi:hypothetical protein